jgi:drug/metabolite transporter (DMT)-like permease
MALLAKLSADAGNRSAALAGIGLMLFSIWLFSFGDALGKYIVGTYSVGQLLLLRGVVAVALLSPLIWRHRAQFTRLRRPGLHLVRVFASAIYLPLADIITYYLAAPIFVTAGAAFFLGEHVGWRRWIAIGIGFGGVLIALQPSAQTVSWPALIALGGSMSFAALMLVTRSLRDTPDLVLATSQFAGTITFGAIMAPFGWVTPPAADFGLFALAACISVGALLSLNRSLMLAPASVVVPYQYTMIIWAVFFGYVVFGDVPSLAILAGAAIIIGAGLYIFLRERRLAREAAVVPPPG